MTKSQRPKVKGQIVDDRLLWTCPKCNKVTKSHINKPVRKFLKSRDISTEMPKLCQSCPPKVFTWCIVEVVDDE